MITRRGFIIAGGGAVGGLALAGASSAFAGIGAERLAIASPSKAALVANGGRHIVLTGNRLNDLATLERVLSAGDVAELTLHVDTSDAVLLDIALTRVDTRYQAVAAQGGALAYRRSSVFGV